jgi:hypothetical protein
LLSHADNGQLQSIEHLGKPGHGVGEGVSVFDGHAHFVHDAPHGSGGELDGIFLECRQHGQAQFKRLVETVVKLDDIPLADALSEDAFAEQSVGVHPAGHQSELLSRQVGFQFLVAGCDGASLYTIRPPSSTAR